MTLSRSERWAVITKLVRETIERTGGKTWLGRIHIQKAVYFLQLFASVDLGYGFVIYQYGPYSSEVDSDVMDLLAFGALKMDVVGGYPDYSLGPTAESVESSLSANTEAPRIRSAITVVAGEVAPRKARDLELLATLAYVRHTEAGPRDEDLVDRVQRLKPHFSTQEVKQALVELGDIARRIATS